MSDEARYFRIGLFVVVALTILAAALVAFGGGQMFRPKLFFETYVDGSVQGVDVGTAVKFRGVTVGRVTAINFLFNEYHITAGTGLKNYVTILMEVDRQIFPDMFASNIAQPLEKAVAEGLRARIEPQGITGLNYIEINFVDPQRFPPLAIDWKPRAYYIPSAPGELTNFLDSINNIMREVEELNIGGMTQSGTELLENLNQSITDARIGQLSGDLQTLFVDLKAAVDAAKLGDLSADARRLIGQLESSNRELGRVLRNLEPATRLPPGEVQKLVSSLTQTARNLEEFSSEVRRRPSLLLWGTAPSPTPEPAKGRVRVVPKAESPR